MDQDPLVSFLSSLSNKIKEEKDHKELMEKINSTDHIELEENPLENAILKLQEKILESKKQLPEAITEQVAVESVTNEIEDVVIDEDADNFGDFLNKLKGVLAGEPLPIKPVDEQVAEKQEEPATVADEKIEQQEEPPKPAKNEYLKALNDVTGEVAKETEPAKVSEIKKLIEEYVGKYIKKAIVMSEYAGGGGTNAVQYAEGGTMHGNLNVNGHILSGGRDISDFFGGSGASQNLSFNESNAQLSISNGNTVSLSALSGGGHGPADRLVNGSYQVVLSSDGQLNVPGAIVTSGGGGSIDTGGRGSIQFGYDGTRTTVQGTATTNRSINLPDNSGTLALTGSVLGTANQIVATNTGGNTTLSFAPSAVFSGDVSIQGNLNISGSATYINTKNLVVDDSLIYLANSNTGNLLDIGLVAHFTQAPLGYQHTGLVRRAGEGRPGTWTLFSGLTTEPLTGNNIDWADKNITIDTLSANILGSLTGANVYTTGGNSNQWNSNYTTTQNNSANWNLGYNAYTILNSNSANYILDGGNTKSADINIGTNDNYNFFLETNNSKNVVITRTGNVGIGTPVITIVANQDLIGYNFFSLINSLASTASPGLAVGTITAGLMTRAAGINAFASTAGWGSQGYSTGSVDIASAIANTEYYTIPIYSTQNTTIVISSLNTFSVDRSPSGPTNMGFLYGTSSNPSLANALAITSLPTTPTNINTGINQALAATPVTITPGTTGYMFLVPYGAAAGGGRLIFQSTYPAGSPNDLSFTGTITDEPYNKLTVAGTLSANTIDINMLKAQSTIPIAGTRTLTSLFLSIMVGTSSLYIPLYR